MPDTPPSPAPAGPPARLLGTWAVDIGSDRVTLSPHAQQLFGVEGTPQPMPFPAVMARIHPDDLPRTMAAILAAFTGGQPYAAEFRLRHGDGSWHPVRSQGRIERDAQGLSMASFGAMADLSAPHDADAVRAALDAALPRVSADRIEDIAC